MADPTAGLLAQLSNPSLNSRLGLLSARLRDAADGGTANQDAYEAEPFKRAQMLQQLQQNQLGLQAMRGALGSVNGAQPDNGAGSMPTGAGQPPQAQGPLTPQEPPVDAQADAAQNANLPTEQQPGGAQAQQAPPPVMAAAPTPTIAPPQPPVLPPNPSGQDLTAYARQKRLLATMALIGGHPDQAATIMKPNLEVDRHGNVVDKETGQLVSHVPVNEYVNGVRVDPNDPNAPQSLPALDKGQIRNPDGSISNAPGYIGALTDAAKAQAAATANANEAAKAVFAPRTAGATAAATAAATAPYEPVTFEGPNGQPITMSKQAFAAYQAKTGGAMGIAPGDKEFAIGQAKDLNTAVGTAIAQREPALMTHNNGMEIRNYALTHNMNDLGERGLAVSKWLNTVPAPILKGAGIDPAKVSASANVGQIAEKLTSQSILQGAKNLLPSRYTERELSLMRPIAGNLNTPSEAMAYNGATMASLAERQIAQAKFAAQYNGPKTQQAFEKAWAESPAGKASLFSSPAWQGVTIGGKPAVTHMNYKGRDYGFFGAGMGKPIPFPLSP
jgi:hypothetical protein